MLFGTSGGGKTSLLNLMGTIDKPTKGEIMLCGDWVKPTTPDVVLAEKRLNRIGFVFQTFNLLSTMTAIENVELPMILAGVLGPAERKARATELLTRVGMGGRLDHLPSQLSGGEQQRVTIARALANEPELLLLDEPTGDLDSRNTEIVLKTLMDLNLQDKITMIMVTHDVNLKGFANRIVWMRDGRVNRVEHVPIAERMENMSVLNEKLLPNKKPEEEDHEGNKVVTFDNTDFRFPTDYPQLVFKRATGGGRATVKAGAHKQEVFTEDAYFGKSNLSMQGGISVPGESAPMAPATKPSRRSSSKGRRSGSASRKGSAGKGKPAAPAAPVSVAATETYVALVTGGEPPVPGKLVTNSNLDALESSIVDLERRSMAHRSKAPSADDAANLVASVASLRGELAQKEMEAAHRRRKAGSGGKEGRVVSDEKSPSAPSDEDTKLAELRRRLAVVEEETSNLQVAGDIQPAKEA